MQIRSALERGVIPCVLFDTRSSRLPRSRACRGASRLPDSFRRRHPRREQLRIIAFGAHPDDAELKFAGTAALFAAQGHKVKLVALTNGDVGHFSQAGGPLAQRRKAEVEACHAKLGVATDVLDIHDGELMPDLETRKKVANLIRDWQADIVLSHRPWDYHPDHRAVGKLAEDAAVVVAAPYFAPYTPPTKGNPIFLFYSDGFKKPYPFDPIIAVGIDEVAQKKWDCISALPSQFGDADSWQARYGRNVPTDEAGRKAYLLDRREAAQRRRGESVPQSAGASCTASRKGARSSTPRRSS